MRTLLHPLVLHHLQPCASVCHIRHAGDKQSENACYKLLHNWVSIVAAAKAFCNNTYLLQKADVYIGGLEP